MHAENSKGQTPLHLASRELSEDVMDLLVAKGAGLNALDLDGRPPLHYCVNSHAKDDMVYDTDDVPYKCIRRLLLDKDKSDINVADNQGNPKYILSFLPPLKILQKPWFLNDHNWVIRLLVELIRTDFVTF